MASQPFNTLKRRARALSRRFLNARVLSNETSELSQDMIKAFRLLMHAELEYYIEQAIIGKASHHLSEWNANGKPSKCLLSILTYCERTFPNVSTQLSDISGTNNLNYRVNSATNAFVSQIRTRNNGIKEANVIPLLIPLGIDPADIDQILLNNLSSYGSGRGDVAHQSYKVVSIINPRDELVNVTSIIRDLEKLDKAISSLR